LGGGDRGIRRALNLGDGNAGRQPGTRNRLVNAAGPTVPRLQTAEPSALNGIGAVRAPSRSHLSRVACPCMLLDERSVSRKTPLDGRLEISAEAADRLTPLGDEFALACAGHDGRARLHKLTCTCEKGSGGSHVHHFVESPLLASLAPGTIVRVELDESAQTVCVEPVVD
jgi:hypothetical protein